jgi:hypothetical protein
MLLFYCFVADADRCDQSVASKSITMLPNILATIRSDTRLLDVDRSRGGYRRSARVWLIMPTIRCLRFCCFCRRCREICVSDSEVVCFFFPLWAIQRHPLLPSRDGAKSPEGKFWIRSSRYPKCTSRDRLVAKPIAFCPTKILT